MVLKRLLSSLCAALRMGLGPFLLHFHVQLRVRCAMRVLNELSVQTH